MQTNLIGRQCRVPSEQKIGTIVGVFCGDRMEAWFLLVEFSDGSLDSISHEDVILVKR